MGRWRRTASPGGSRAEGNAAGEESCAAELQGVIDIWSGRSSLPLVISGAGSVWGKCSCHLRDLAVAR